MNSKLKKICTYGSVSVVALVLSGCAGDQMMMEEQKMMMQSSVDEAMRKANTADYKAGVAKSMADEALTKLNQMRTQLMKQGMKMEMMK